MPLAVCHLISGLSIIFLTDWWVPIEIGSDWSGNGGIDLCIHSSCSRNQCRHLKRPAFRLEFLCLRKTQGAFPLTLKQKLWTENKPRGVHVGFVPPPKNQADPCNILSVTRGHNIVAVTLLDTTFLQLFFCYLSLHTAVGSSCVPTYRR